MSCWRSKFAQIKYAKHLFSFSISDWQEIREALEQTVCQTVELLLEPTKNGLIPKSD